MVDDVKRLFWEEAMDIDAIIKMLDEKTEAGVSRIKVLVDEEQPEDVKQVYHHGRCDVGSPWANGSVGNCD